MPGTISPAWLGPCGKQRPLPRKPGDGGSVALFKRLAGIRYDTGDAIVRGTCLMMAVGRLGCIAAHCCFGIVVPWGVDCGDGRPRVPVQALEVAALFALLLVMNHLHRHDRF